MEYYHIECLFIKITMLYLFCIEYRLQEFSNRR